MKILINREVNSKFQRFSYCDGAYSVEINLSCKEIKEGKPGFTNSLRANNKGYPHTYYDSTSNFIIEIPIRRSLKKEFLKLFCDFLEKKQISEKNKHYQFFEENYKAKEEFNSFLLTAENIRHDLFKEQHQRSSLNEHDTFFSFFKHEGKPYDEQFLSVETCPKT